MRSHLMSCVGVLVVLESFVAAAEPPRVVGWRGNWMGTFPDATVPASWEKRSKSPIAELSCQAGKPKDEAATGGTPVVYGFLAHWLTAGPLTAEDPAKAIDQEFVAKEGDAAPAEGEKVQDAAWTLQDRVSREEVARSPAMKDAPWNAGSENVLNFAELYGGKKAGRVAYGHTYLFCPRAGAVQLTFNHNGAAKCWLNGKEVYANAKDSQAWGYNYWAMNELITGNPPPAAVKLELNKGWNRLLVKVAAGKDGWFFDGRLTAPPDAGYVTKNIAWETKLPMWSRAMPVIVGDKIFVMSEPDELVCLNKADGKVMWRRTHTFFDAATPQEREASPIFKQVEPLMAKMQEAQGYEEVFALRRKMQELLKKIDAKKYAWPKPAHTPAHGFTTPTPCSDGQNVYVLVGNGVAACYDLEGNRKWIVRTDDIGHAGDFNVQSPALVAGKLILYRGGHFRALDAATGQTLWTSELGANGIDIWHGDKQSPSTNWSGSVIPARVGDVDVVMGSIKGKICRVSDGKMVCNVLTYTTNDSYLALGDVVFNGGLVRNKIRAVSPDVMEFAQTGAAEGPSGFATALYHEGLVYTLSPHGELGVFESTEKGVALVYRKMLPFLPFFHGDGPGCTASPVLAGKFIVLMDNKGTAVTVEPGRTFKQISVNVIENFVARSVPACGQEDTYSTPICDGARMYIRGEENIYCIGEK